MTLLFNTNAYGETWYFVSLGDNWGRGDYRRLIAETTQDRGRARIFDTLPEALDVLIIAGDPPGWSAEPII